MQLVLAYTTFPSAAVADRISGELVAMRLAACVNLLPGMTSTYLWKGEICRDAEIVGIIKTRASLIPRIVGAVRILHPYDTPALVTVPVIDGAPEFLEWLATETRQPA